MTPLGETNVFDLSPVDLGPAIIFALALFATVGTALTRRFVLPYIKDDHDRGQRHVELVQTLLVVYGLVACLILISTFRTYSDASVTVSREANQIGRLYKEVSFYPEPEKSRLQGMLREYAKYLIDEAWPQIERGDPHIAGDRNLSEIQRELERFEPSTEEQRVLHDRTLSTFERLSNGTHARMEAVATALPKMFWFFIVFGAIISVGATFFLDPERGTDHRKFVLFLSMLFGLIIFLILSLDRPFRGHWRVGSLPYQRVYEGLMNQ